jgi:5-methylcytosine-specific restriction endonuclease McrA
MSETFFIADTNNEISNLEFLCPNCHSQTITFTGRNNRRHMSSKHIRSVGVGGEK